MNESFEQAFRELVALSGLKTPGTEALLDDEHERFDFYRSLFNHSQEQDDKVLDAITIDTDLAMAESALFSLLGARRQQLDNDEFRSWAKLHGPRLASFEMASQRLDEYLLEQCIEAGEQEPEALHRSSLWLQQKMAGGSNSEKVLGFLSQQGLSKRIREQATARLRNLPLAN